jgi:hypothetical protein
MACSGTQWSIRAVAEAPRRSWSLAIRSALTPSANQLCQIREVLYIEVSASPERRGPPNRKVRFRTTYLLSLSRLTSAKSGLNGVSKGTCCEDIPKRDE